MCFFGKPDGNGNHSECLLLIVSVSNCITRVAKFSKAGPSCSHDAESICPANHCLKTNQWKFSGLD